MADAAVNFHPNRRGRSRDPDGNTAGRANADRDRPANADGWTDSFSNHHNPHSLSADGSDTIGDCDATNQYPATSLPYPAPTLAVAGHGLA